MASTETFCDVCGVQVAPGNMPLHAQGKKHVRMALVKHHRQAEAERSVYVRGFPPATTTHTLTKFFSKFGEVAKVFLQKEKGFFAFVEFKTAGSVRSVLQCRSHYFCGQRLMVRQREVKAVSVPLSKAPRKPPDHPTVTPAPGVDQDQVVQALRSAESVIDQLTQLKDLVGLTEQDIQDRNEIVKSLQSVFENRIEGCRVHQFGSSVNGFGVRGYDMDLLLDLGLGPAPAADDPAAQAVFRIEDGPGLKASLTRATLMHRAGYIKKMLSRSNLLFSQLLLIPATRCPVIRFVEAKRGVQCDLSLSTGLSLQNTELLQFLCRLDARVQPLVFALRFFFKSCEISGGTSGSQRLSSYALCWLVMTYLQTCQPPLLPPIGHLSELAEEKTTIDGWDCSFTRDPAKCTMTERNDSSLVRLLCGFFEFFCKVNFADTVICPRDGKLLLVSEFRQLAATRPGQGDFKFNVVNIQDPFVLNHNVAQNVNDRLAERLQDELLEARAKCSCAQFTTPGEDHDWGLTFLVSKDRLTPLPNQSTSTKTKSAPGGFDYMVETEFRPANIPQRVFAESRGVEEVRDRWTKEVCRLLKETLEEVLLFTCQVQADEQLEKLGQQSEQVRELGQKRQKVPEPGQQSEQVKDLGQQSEQVPELGQQSEQVPESGHQNEQVKDLGQQSEQVPELGQQSEQVSESGHQNEQVKDLGHIGEQVTKVGHSQGNCSSGGPLQPRDSGSQDNLKVDRPQAGAMDPSEQLIEIGQLAVNNSTETCDNVEANGQGVAKKSESKGNIAKAQKRPSTETDPTEPTAKRTCTENTDGLENKAQAESSETLQVESAVQKPVTEGGVEITDNDSTQVDRGTEKLSVQTLDKKSAKEMLLLAMSCSTAYQMWAGRKRVKKALRQTGGELQEDSMDLEKLITRTLHQEIGQLDINPILQFEVRVLRTVSENGKCKVHLQMRPTVAPKMFSCFYQFFSTFFSKLMEKSLFR